MLSVLSTFTFHLPGLLSVSNFQLTEVFFPFSFSFLSVSVVCSSLRFESTEHLAAHLSQLDGLAVLGVVFMEDKGVDVVQVAARNAHPLRLGERLPLSPLEDPGGAHVTHVRSVVSEHHSSRILGDGHQTTLQRQPLRRVGVSGPPDEVPLHPDGERP